MSSSTTRAGTDASRRAPAAGGLPWPRTSVRRAPLKLRLSDFPNKEHLAGDGNWLYKIPFGDGFAVLKVYFGNRHPALHWKKTFGNLVFTGRTSHMPRARCRTEIESIQLWEQHGFRCFGMYPEVVFEDLPAGGYMLFEYVPGVHFKTYFRDESIPLQERLATWRRWLPEWHRRHKLAIELRDPRLIHENGDVKHVMLWQGGFVNFDFEVCFRSHDLPDLVGREMLAYLRFLGKAFGPELYDVMMDETVRHYPDKALLMQGWAHAMHNHNPFVRFFRMLDRKLRRKDNDKPYSKYSVAQDLKRRLDAAALNL